MKRVRSSVRNQIERFRPVDLPGWRPSTTSEERSPSDGHAHGEGQPVTRGLSTPSPES